MIDPQYVALVAAVGLVVDGLEHARAAHAERRAFDVDVVVTSYPVLIARPAVARLFASLLGGISLVAGARALLAVTATILFAADSGTAAAICSAGVAATTLALSARLVYGLDGSDQMQLVVWGGLAATATAGDLALKFVALQLVLAYMVAGIAKCAGASWRSGQALAAILSTASYGSPRLSCVVAARPLGLVACWSVIVFEVAMPPLAATTYVGLCLLVVVAVSFHVGTAVTMGLNSFVWAFTAALLCLASWFPLI